jgi:hypothetical protein
MKTIQPVNVWFNGEQKQATVLSAYSSLDNLSNAASFSYQLLAESNPLTISGLEQVVSGSLTMTGEVYKNWDSNDYAYNWVAEQLKLTITGPYVPPTTTTTTTTTTEAPTTTTTTEA